MQRKLSVHEDEIRDIELEGRSVKQLIDSDIGARNMLLGSGLYESGRQMPFHQHDDAEEVFYVISGYGEIRIGDQKEPLRPGSAVYIPPNTKHSILVGADAPMKIVFVFSPPQIPGSAIEAISDD